MSGAQRRGARRELEVARQLGSRRVRRARFESLPDVRLDDGTVLVPEVKTRGRRCSALVEGALAQAARYVPGGVPLAVISSTGRRAIACVYLDDFARLVGLRSPRASEQLVLLAPPVKRA